MTNNIFAQDIALDLATMQPRVAANGELVLCDGTDTGVQDVVLRLFTYLGTLFYDVEFGSTAHDWIKEESTTATRSAFCVEVVRCINTDPRVIPMSATCKIISWDENGIVSSANWRFIENSHPHNLIFKVGTEGQVAEVIEDGNPR